MAVYPVILSKDKSGYFVTVPDFEVNTEGKDLGEAIFMARDAIGINALQLEDEGKELPKPFSKAIEKEEGLTQITAATATDAGDKAILSETDSDKNAKVRMIIVEETTNGGKVKAVIPSGFYYVTGKPSTGLVISDKFDDDDNNSII